MRREPTAPLAQRDGVDPTRLRLPGDGPWSTLRDHLVDRLPVPAPDVDAMLQQGRVFGADGPLPADAAFWPGTSVWFHRDLPDETAVPFEIDVLHADDDIVVVDKPHFLATMPRGSHVVQTALVRLRRLLGAAELSPAHRLDRLTAGVLLFVRRPELRGAYQKLFQERRVRKEYEAISRHDPVVQLPRTVRSRIIKRRGQLAAREEPGEVNAETRVQLLERSGGLARYRLLPRTGRTHQLRVHMDRLGIPILGDDLYPEQAPRAADDFTRPLQLLARTIEFTDPISGGSRRFESRRELDAWSG